MGEVECSFKYREQRTLLSFLPIHLKQRAEFRRQEKFYSMFWCENKDEDVNIAIPCQASTRDCS